MKVSRHRLAAVIMLVLGLGLVSLGAWGLYSGRMLSTWGRIERPPSAIYWITVAALLLIGGVNVVTGVRGLLVKR